MAPASILQTHPNTTLYLDRDSAALLGRGDSRRDPRKRRVMRLELPGLFDLQVNGFGGIDFNAPDLTADRVGEALERMRAHRRDPLPADAHHLVIRRSSPRAHASSRGCPMRRSPASTWKGPYLSPEDGPRGAHPREHVQAGERRRLQPPAGRRRRPDRARHARARSAGRAAAHRTSGRDGRARRDRPYRGDAATDRRRDRRRRDARDASGQRLRADAAAPSERRSGSCWRPTRCSPA